MCGEGGPPAYLVRLVHGRFVSPELVQGFTVELTRARLAMPSPEDLAP
jgi:hypothetical protein